MGRSGGFRLNSRLSTSDRLACALVGKKPSINDVKQLPLEDTQGFHLALALNELAVIIDAARPIAANLNSRGNIKNLIHLPVAAAGQPMASHITRGCFERGGAGERGEMPAIGEAVGIIDDQQDRRCTDLTDTADINQHNTIGDKRLKQSLLNDGDALVEPADLLEQLAGEELAFELHGAAGGDLAQ